MTINPLSRLREESRDEAYVYFDKHIRPLTKDSSGKVDITAHGLEGNDVDAFRHAYVSGVFTQEYGETAADILGRLNELDPLSLYSNLKNPEAINMDYWNNEIGRKYGKSTKSREELARKIHNAMKNGELITTTKDSRKFEGASHNPENASKPLIVLGESESGRNEFFFDTTAREVLSREKVVTKIEAGQYPGYAVKMIHGLPTPVSKPDSRNTNNLG